MSPKERFEGWVSSHAIRFILYAVGIGMAWGALTAEVSRKADKDVVDAQFGELRHEQQAMKRMLCRMAGNAKDSSCP